MSHPQTDERLKSSTANASAAGADGVLKLLSEIGALNVRLDVQV
ncbi:MAG: hypothetical protein ACHBNF_19225 [Chromatiales bacterium]